MKTYKVPEIRELGTITSLTEAFGDKVDTDTAFINGEIFGTGLGSRDGVVVPGGGG